MTLLELCEAYVWDMKEYGREVANQALAGKGVKSPVADAIILTFRDDGTAIRLWNAVGGSRDDFRFVAE